MDESWANRFFGRKGEVRELVEKFKKHRLIAIVADSGAGKSSLAQAGLIPAFRGGALADEGREEPEDNIWHVVVMRPGSDPIQGSKDGITDAAKLLGMEGAEQSSLRSRLDISDPGESAYALRCDLDRKKTETLLIIDQFEELLIQTPRRETRAFRRFSLRPGGRPVRLSHPGHAAGRLFQFRRLSPTIAFSPLGRWAGRRVPAETHERPSSRRNGQGAARPGWI
jgi:hypothetical protein